MPDPDSYDVNEGVVWSVNYVDGSTYIMCVCTGNTILQIDRIIKGPSLYQMMRAPNAKDLVEEDEKREMHGGWKRMSVQQHNEAEAATRTKQAEQDTIEEYVASHPDVYGNLEELHQQNKDAIKACQVRYDEIHDCYLAADELLDDRTETLIAEDPDTAKNKEVLKVLLKARDEYSASRKKINKDILSQMAQVAQ